MSSQSDDDEGDQLEDEEPPRVRPARMVIASILGIPAIVITILSIVSLTSERPEPNGEITVILQPLSTAIAWLALIVFGVTGALCTVVLVGALLEARRARQEQAK